MNWSCTNHPSKDPLMMIRRWQLLACDGNHCAAGLLQFFGYWHDFKIHQSKKAKQANEIAELHGDSRSQDESFLQFYSTEELIESMLGLYGKKSIQAALKLLESKGFIEIRSNPNPRYAFDKTKFFLYRDDTVNEWLESVFSEKNPDRAKVSDRSAKNAPPSGENGEPSGENGRSLLETTSETTTKTTSTPQTPQGGLGEAGSDDSSGDEEESGHGNGRINVTDSFQLSPDDTTHRNGGPKDESADCGPKSANPKKRSKKKAVPWPEMPESLARSSEFREVWEEWLEWRATECKKAGPVGPIAAKQQFRDLESMGVDEAIQSMRKSMNAGWAGLFPVLGDNVKKRVIPDHEANPDF